MEHTRITVDVGAMQNLWKVNDTYTHMDVLDELYFYFEYNLYKYQDGEFHIKFTCEHNKTEFTEIPIFAKIFKQCNEIKVLDFY